MKSVVKKEQPRRNHFLGAFFIKSTRDYYLLPGAGLVSLAAAVSAFWFMTAPAVLVSGTLSSNETEIGRRAILQSAALTNGFISK